jgi:DNA-binding NarL/FixJ family response regulator
MSNHPLRVLLLEDSSSDAELVSATLQRRGVAHAAERVDAEAAFGAALESFAPDVVLSDHSLAQFDALAALRMLRERRPGTPLIVVSGAAEPDAVVRCLKAGAFDYISKNDLARLPGALMDAVSLRAPLERLTPRQRQVLHLIALGHPTREVARQLGLSVKTVETHRTQMMKRLEIKEVAGLVRFAVRVGLVSANPD